MNRLEIRAAVSLAMVFSVRLLGLFMIYPVFAAYARHLNGATPARIGLALGAYGLSQGLLQIPFGLLSDRIGRKTMITIGLALFGIGSVIAAVSTTIDGVMIGRVIQGTGAVGSVILALVADLTREESRTKAMAVVGLTIGLSFMVALVTGPIFAGLIGVSGIFWLMAGLGVVGIAITYWVVPTPRRILAHRDAETVPSLFGSVLRDRELLRLDFGIFALHAILTSSFLVMPRILGDAFAVTSETQWTIYLPVLVVAVALMIPAIIVAEKYRRMKGVFVTAIVVLLASQVGLMLDARSPAVILAAIVAFFTAFNLMEASLPSLVTKAAPAGAKGTATGVYSSAQFLGIFVGGAIGGWVHGLAGASGVFALAAGIAAVWLAVATTMRKPGHYSTYLARLGDIATADGKRLAARLGRVPGVVDVIVVAEEGMGYLKIDPDTFDASAVEAIIAEAGASA